MQCGLWRVRSIELTQRPRGSHPSTLKDTPTAIGAGLSMAVALLIETPQNRHFDRCALAVALQRVITSLLQRGVVCLHDAVWTHSRPAAIRLPRQLRVGRTSCSWRGAPSTGGIWTTGCRLSGNYWTRLAPNGSLRQSCDLKMSSRSHDPIFPLIEKGALRSRPTAS